MKKVINNKILNISDKNLFDNRFLFEYIDEITNDNIEVIYMKDLLEKKKNNSLLEKIKQKPAIYANVYSMEDELDIFMELYDNAIKNNKKIHIIGITLKEELQILEEYYTKLGFLREDINCFNVDFSKPLITVSVNIENLIWKGSDYKFWREKIFFVPPIRESGQNKAMFKGINRGVIAGINISKFNTEVEQFLGDCIRNEKILALTMTKILNFNLIQIGFIGKQKELIINY